MAACWISCRREVTIIEVLSGFVHVSKVKACGLNMVALLEIVHIHIQVAVRGS
jgi:hypothetical protein